MGEMKWTQWNVQEDQPAAYLQLEVELHVAPARVVRVLLEDEPEGRFSLVQVAVLQQELLLGLSPRHQPVLHLVVPAGGVQGPQARLVVVSVALVDWTRLDWTGLVCVSPAVVAHAQVKVVAEVGVHEGPVAVVTMQVVGLHHWRWGGDHKNLCRSRRQEHGSLSRLSSTSLLATGGCRWVLGGGCRGRSSAPVMRIKTV